MKRILLTLSFIVLAIANAFAEDITVNGFNYTVTYTSNTYVNRVALKSYNWPSGNVVIPSSFYYGPDLYRVTEIQSGAFKNCTGLTSVTIGDYVENIGSGAFNGCSNLESLTFSNSVTNVGKDVFDGCDNLQYNEYDNALYLGSTDNPYFCLVKPKSIDITTCSINGNCKLICSYAFESCNNLSVVSIPASVTNIGINAFNNSSIKFYCEAQSQPNGWWYKWNSGSTFGNDGYYEYWNNNRGVINWDLPVSFFADDIAYRIVKDYTVEVVKYIGASSSLEIPSTVVLDDVEHTVESIREKAFFYSTLTSITIPNTMKSIGNVAFYECRGLASINIPNSVTSIGHDAFYYCTNLTTVDLPNSLTSISDYTFCGCSGLTSVTIPNTITSIGVSAFHHCNGLTTITIPDAVIYVGNDAFANCNSFTSITTNSDADFSNANLCFTKNDIKYRVLAKDKVELVSVPTTCSFETAMQPVVAGNTFNVTGIGCYAFENRTDFTSITIPDCVTRIGAGAFSGCAGLTSISIPEGITSIESNTFKDCSSLTSLIIPNSVTDIADGALNGCSSLESITLPFVGKKVLRYYDGSRTYYEYIPFGYIFGEGGEFLQASWMSPNYYNGSEFSYTYHYAIPSTLKYVTVTDGDVVNGVFSGCSGLESVTLPENITSIGEKVFEGCSGLTTITIPNSVTVVGPNAFYNCGSLSSVTIPNSVTTIGNNAFNNCSSLSSVTIPLSVTSIGNTAFNSSNITFICEAQSKPEGWGNPYTSNCDYTWNYCKGTIYWGVSFIKDGIAYKIGEGNTVAAVKYIGTAESVVIPSTVEHNGLQYAVTSIGANAFQNCNSLKSLTIPSSIGSIGDDAFSGCDNIETLSYNTNAIGAQFSQKQSLSTIEIGSEVTTISANAFSGCSGLSQVVIPDNVSTIGANAFQNCSGLSSVSLPSSLTTINDYLFAGCTNLESISIPSTVTTIGNCAFNSTGLTSITLSNNVTSIGANAFQNCSDLSSVSLSTSITSINEYAFTGCSNLQSISIPRSVTGIGSYAFSGTGLTSVSFPNQVATIGAYTFQNCIHLKTVNIPSSVGSIGVNAFSGCDSITTLSFNTNAIGLLFAGKQLLSTINIGEEVTSIPNSAFANTNLTTVALPDNVTSVGAYAFENCKHLKTVSIPSSVESIGGGAFAGCDSIKTLSFNTDAIGAQFSGKQNLLSVDIGEAVTTLADNAFSGCSKLPAIIIPNTVTSVGASAFDDCSSLTIYCMCTETYGRNNWDSNWNPDNRPVSWQIIISDDFYYQTINSANIAVVKYRGSKPSVSIPSNPTINGRICNVVGIAENAFANNDNLKQIVIPNSIKTIGEYAFSRCANLESVVIGNGVTAIGEAAFSDCNKVESFKIGCTTPPTITETTLEISGWATIYVPCNAESTYSTAAVWCDYYYEETQSYILAVSSENEHKGTAKVKQQPTCEGAAVIEATANAGYSFSSWSDGNTANPRTLTVNNDIMLTALFEVDINVAITSSDAERGYVENITPIYEFDYNAPLTVKAVPNYGYYFICWNDDVTDNPRTITLNQEVAIQAIFGVNQYQLTLGVNNATMGSIEDASGVYYYKDNVNTSATANYGYHFVKWSDGETEKSRTITIAKDTVIKAEFAINQYAITLQANVAERGSVSGAGSFNYLANKQIAATANYGYVFEKWSDGITTNPRTIALSQDTAFTAVFVLDKFNLQVTSGNAELGSVAGGKTAEYKEAAEISATATAAHYHFNGWTDGNRQNPRTVQVISDTAFVATFAIDSFKITATSRAEEFGSVSGGGLYAYGTAVEVKALPQPHCHFVEWSNDASGMVQMFNVEKDTAIAAVFAIDSHRLQVASADSTMGTATGSGVYDYGTQVVLTATPAANCNFVSWSDGSTTNPRTLTLVSDTAVVANFTQMAEYEVRALPSAAERGTVSGSGSYRVGTEVKLLATANEHYLFNQWSDGHTENPRTVRVIADATYTAVFAPEQYSVTLSQNNADMGMVSGSGIYSYGDVVSCLAKPYQNYHFVQWSNGETANPYEFVIEGNQLLTAYFAAGAVTAIDDDAAAEPIIYAVGRTIVVENSTSQITIYDSMGRLIVSDVANGERTELNVDVAGVYIVKVGNTVKRMMVE